MPAPAPAGSAWHWPGRAHNLNDHRLATSDLDAPDSDLNLQSGTIISVRRLGRATLELGVMSKLARRGSSWIATECHSVTLTVLPQCHRGTYLLQCSSTAAVSACQ